MPPFFLSKILVSNSESGSFFLPKILGRDYDGIIAEWKKNRHFIRVYDHWRSNAITATAAMKLLDMKSNTFYRRVMEYESQVGKKLLVQ
jgi:hypothetical protein